MVPPLSSRTQRSGWAAGAACVFTSRMGVGRGDRDSNEKMEGKEEEGLGRREAPPFFSLLFLGI